MRGEVADIDVRDERWGDDPKLVDVLGEQGAEGFRAVLDNFPELVGVLWAIRDDDGRIVDFSFGYGNPAILRSFRLPAATRDRYTLLEALPQMRNSEAFRAYMRVVDHGDPWVQEITYDTPFGDGYMLGTFIERTMKLGDGLVTFLTDVTEQRRMEAELRSYAEVVAHDLREPIMAMALLVTLLERSTGEAPPAEVLEQLRESTARARELVDCVLAYARAGVLSTEPVALCTLVAEVEQDLRPRLDETDAVLEVGELPEVEGDPRQLRRVLQNLIANSLKFRSDAPPRVELSAERGSHEWIVSVRDNGIGVDPTQAGRIFGLFSRGTASVDGVGIGLAMCRRIVEAHGGRIWVEPAEEGGSVFRFTLPHAGPELR
jgi:signal transduction histidine kinase